LSEYPVRENEAIGLSEQREVLIETRRDECVLLVRLEAAVRSKGEVETLRGVVLIVSPIELGEDAEVRLAAPVVSIVSSRGAS